MSAIMCEIAGKKVPAWKEEFDFLCQLNTLSDEYLNNRDIIDLNLLCAAHLPGSKEIDTDIAKCKAALDEWASHIRQVIERSHRRSGHDAPAHAYDEPYSRIRLVTEVLQKQYRIGHDRQKIESMRWADSRDLFVHGLIGPKRSGIAPTLPVLLVAIGRRLRYPLKLGLAQGHLFSRWDDPSTGINFNIEWDGRVLNMMPDGDYRRWWIKQTPRPREAEEALKCLPFRSLTPREELAHFVAQRGHVSECLGRFAEAIEAYNTAANLSHDPAYEDSAKVVEHRVADPFYQPVYPKLETKGPVEKRSSVPPKQQKGARRWPTAQMPKSASTDDYFTEHLYQFGRYAIMRLYETPVADVPRYDLAEMNLISAHGLHGTENMDIGALLAELDTWAKQVASYTVKNMKTYHARRAEFGSLARFRVTAMLTCLTRELGMRYNPERIIDPDNFDDPADSFIHGLLGPRRMGTCASLPVLLTALGRRLRYPIKVVVAPAHAFCRWDSPEERFNIEYNEKGLNSPADDHYLEWPHKWTPGVHEQNQKQPFYLISMTPQQELAYCAKVRAYQLENAGRYAEALAAAQVCYRLWPNHFVAVYELHLGTKAHFPERKWPELPCEETAGQEAIDRLAAKGVLIGYDSASLSLTA